MTAVTAIRNVGPKMAAAFGRAGIRSAEEIRDLGADGAYRRLLAAGQRPHFIAYYSLVLGLQGRPWTDLGTAEKTELRRRFDALCADGADPARARLEAELNRLGVVPGD